jgi:putative N-acetylmannosamine-6-phosphate 2-epimerase 2
MKADVEQIQWQLIVSCQALEDEPLHSSFIMGRMALAAKQGGAKGIRANTVEDIREIRKNVDLPIIGIIKRDYEDSEIYITPTMREIDELAEVEPEIIALDATFSKRPFGESLSDFYAKIRIKYPDQLLMADCSTMDEIIFADKLGFDYIGTTLVGYTKQSRDIKIEADDFAFISEALDKVNAKLIAEGNINTPQKLKRVMELGVYSTVVGSAITRPQLITKSFTSVLT